MFCGQCGSRLVEGAKFCGSCGHAAPPEVKSATVIAPGDGKKPHYLALDAKGPGTPVPSDRSIPSPPHRRLGFVLGIAAALLLSVGGYLVARRHGTASEPAVNSPAPTASVSTLDGMGAVCNVLNEGGKRVDFASTQVNSHWPLGRQQACDMAASAARRQAGRVSGALTQSCKSLLPPDSAFRGQSREQIKQFWIEQGTADADADVIATGTAVCNDPTAYEKEWMSSHAPRIYSVGDITLSGHTCQAYLEEQSEYVYAGGPADRIYLLRGLGECSSLTFDESKIFNKDSNPSAPMPGDYIVATYHYTGVMSKDWVSEDHTYPFTSAAGQASSDPRPTGGSEMPAPTQAAVTSTIVNAPLAVSTESVNTGSPEQHSATADGLNATDGADTVRVFYLALGRGDGVQANALMVLAKRASPAYQPDAIESFYGHMAEPLTLISVSAAGSADFDVRYRYRKQTALCEGHVIVTTERADGRVLISKIRPIGNC